MTVTKNLVSCSKAPGQQQLQERSLSTVLPLCTASYNLCIDLTPFKWFSLTLGDTHHMPNTMLNPLHHLMYICTVTLQGNYCSYLCSKMRRPRLAMHNHLASVTSAWQIWNSKLGNNHWSTCLSYSTKHRLFPTYVYQSPQSSEETSEYVPHR
jgi:hypothetical protein